MMKLMVPYFVSNSHKVKTALQHVPPESSGLMQHTFHYQCVLLLPIQGVASLHMIQTFCMIESYAGHSSCL